MSAELEKQIEKINILIFYPKRFDIIVYFLTHICYINDVMKY